MLRSWRVRAHTARIPEQAEALLSKLDSPPDLVIADYTLAHGERGTDVIAVTRRYGTAAAILLTGDTSPDRLAEAERSGSRLLHKPVSSDTLGVVIMDVCSKS